MMSEERFEGTSFRSGDQLNLHEASAHAMSFEELRIKQQEQAIVPEAAPEMPKSPEMMAVERVLATGQFIDAYRRDRLEEQQVA